MRLFTLFLFACTGATPFFGGAPFLLAQVGMSDDPGAGPHAQSQSAADFLRDEAGADLAFLPAGMLNKDAIGDLATLLKYPTDELVILRLTGKEVLGALERSVSYYPESNSAFLQISGAVVTFSVSAQPGSRILSVEIGGVPLDPNNRYNVAMPASLARGALGYFKIWDTNKIDKSLGVTLEKILKGKTGAVRTPRYVVRP